MKLLIALGQYRSESGANGYAKRIEAEVISRWNGRVKPFVRTLVRTQPNYIDRFQVELIGDFPSAMIDLTFSSNKNVDAKLTPA